MSMYVKKKDGTIVESQCETVKVTENTLKNLLDTTKQMHHIVGYSAVLSKAIDASQLLKFSDTENVIDMSYAFAGELSSNDYKYYQNRITHIPLLDTRNVTNMAYMFAFVHYENNKDGIPLYDTSKVTDMSHLFEGFQYFALSFNYPNFNTSNVTNMDYMFSGLYWKDNDNAEKKQGFILPDSLDTHNVTSMSCMFSPQTTKGSINDGPYRVPMMDTSNVTMMYSMFNGCSVLKSIPLYDTSKAENISYIFNKCSKLTEIPALNFSTANFGYNIFGGCSNLEEIHCTGLKISFDIHYSTKFTESALVEILNNLGTPTSSQTLTMGATNLAKLTDEEKAIATDKGWTLK